MNKNFIPILFAVQIFLGSPLIAQDTLRLEEAVVIAIQKNYDITLAAKDSRIAELNNTAGAAGMLPKLTLSGNRSLGVSKTYEQYNDGREKQSPNAKSNNLSGGATLAWTLFDGFNMFIQKNRLNELKYMTDLQLQSVIENTVTDVVLAYYAIITQQKMVEVYREAMAITSERKRIAKAGVSFGSSSELSFLQASVDYNADSSAYIQQAKMLENNKVELNRLLCRDLFQPFSVTPDIPVQTGLVFDQLWMKVKEENPEIRMARTNLSIALLERKMTNSSLYPRLNFTSGYNYTKTVSDVAITSLSQRNGFNVGINASYTLFDGFNEKNNRSKSQIRLESAKLEVEQSELNSKAHLQRIFNEYETNHQLADFEQKNVALAMQNLKVAQEKYRIGSSNDIELRETQKKLMDAENRFLTAQFRCKASETELMRMSGQLSR